MEGKNIIRKELVNVNLLSLKCLMFCFFGGMGCLFPFLPLHMLATGLTYEEAKIVSIVSPIVAMIGPLVAGPLADKWAGRQGSNNRASTGKYLRVMIAVTCILGAIFYAALMAIPRVERLTIPQERNPQVKFSCNESGAIIFKDRCKLSATCYEWPEIKPGPIRLTNCDYRCKPIDSKPLVQDDVNSPKPLNMDYFDQGESSGDLSVIPIEENEQLFLDIQNPSKSDYERKPPIEPPHLCVKKDGFDICHVYTTSSGNVTIYATLQQARNPDETSERCAYPLSDQFSCRIPKQLKAEMLELNKSCSIDCDLYEPYNMSDSVLAQAECQQIIGDPDHTFWSYLVVRSIADVFPTTAVALLDAAVVIATRETSCGRGDVGRQLAFGSLGFAIFGPLTGYLTTLVEGAKPSFSIPIEIFVALMVISALIAVFANGMPLSPPEWWWHTRSGMLALPMSAIKRYGGETAALLFVLVIMGIFWSAMDTYLPWHLEQLNADVVLIGICLTIGALPAVIFLWKSEHLVDYCGHSNLLITAFTIYIVRFTGLSRVSGDPWWSLASEVLELFTLGIMWVTAILYLRHLVPRHLTVTAQALPVIAHFCIGRCIGAVISAYVDVGERNVDSLRFVYKCMAVAAAIIALKYFIWYHALIRPKCHAQSTQGPRQPPTIMEAMNGNGNYTPLRVYHNGRGRKGQFRY